ncbi:aminoacyl-tRNA hydrolase [Candidatus Methylomicrobium oryzae]|uniref:aminoacyl-tRNA hydrolase n=1 Tax=Candidatus Methylomicrobium oryzae TaxID=2802053 RepID=UPI0019208957|nr:aminoacyl-tRNA hydrolase [Methylomicrobium sp. RS1]
MIKLIVGLGNPGRQYEKTRHNAGFLFVDCLVRDLGSAFAQAPRFLGEFAECRVGGEKLLLLKPATFMNRSGQSVAALLKYYKLQADQVLVVHDELDFNPGVVKLKKDGGHAGHNGLRDIIAHLNTKDFYRLRLGIGRPPAGKVVADFVLSVPSKQEADLLDGAIKTGLSFVPQMVVGEIDAAMNKINI